MYILSVFLLSMIINNCASYQQEFEDILDNTEFSVKILIFTLNFYSQFFNSQFFEYYDRICSKMSIFMTTVIPQWTTHNIMLCSDK